MKPKVLLQHLLPHRLLSRLAYRAARSQWTPGKQLLIDQVVRRFGVDLDEAEQPDARAYPSFNAFFTRALRHGARIADPDPQALLMPADGRVSQLGRIEQGRIFAAKGQHFTATELLGNADAAQAFACGHFATVYLSPRDYHRVHMPWTGTLRETLHVPGRLFTVAPWGVEAIPRLFARNERLVCHFDCDFGPMAVVMVGAMLVSGVETVWGGEEIPPFGNGLRHRDWRGKGIVLERFAEMARFNYGSTVIVLFPDGVAELEALEPQQIVRVGQRLGTVAAVEGRGESPAD
jgi:phosphatidylserine decarboxylase